MGVITYPCPHHRLTILVKGPQAIIYLLSFQMTNSLIVNYLLMSCIYDEFIIHMG